LDPIPNAKFVAVGKAGFERDRVACEAIETDHTALKPLEMALPFLLAVAGAGIGVDAEYGTPFNRQEHPQHGGKLLIGFAVGGFVVGALISAIGVWSRKDAQATSVHDCLIGRGYEFPR
jgi:hypothetical protein